MALTTMYPGVNNSVPTLTTALLTATATTIELEDASVLPPGPNLVTLGTEDNAEVVRYEAISGSMLVGCVRGYSGVVAQIWPAGTLVYRAYTALDHRAFIDNIEDLDARKLGGEDYVSDTRVAFNPALFTANIFTNEKLATICGKLAKWYASFGQGAWASFGAGQSQIARGNHAHEGYAQSGADGKVLPEALTTKTVIVGENRLLALSDQCRCLDVSAAGEVTLTIPAEKTVAFPIDTEIEIAREGLGAARVALEDGVTLYSTRGRHAQGVTIANRYGVIILKKKGANDWRVAGDLA